MAFAMFNVSGIMVQRLRRIFQRSYSEAKFPQITSKVSSKDVKMMEEYVYETDILIVGGNPAGLSAAIQARRLAEKHSKELRVTLVENKFANDCLVYSGACLDPIVLNELFPNWKELGAPLNTPVTEDKFAFLTENRRISIPISKGMCHHGNYIVRLSHIVKWLSEQAEAAGVEIYPKNEVIEVLYHEDGSVKGVITRDSGRYIYSLETPCIHREHHARCTIFAKEYFRWSSYLENRLSDKFNLRKDCEQHIYGVELRQIWEIEPRMHRPGTMERMIGWPLNRHIYGGSFLYHLNEERPLVVIGFVMDEDEFYEDRDYRYSNEIPILQHPSIEPTFDGGKRVDDFSWMVVVQGGFQSIPKLHFPGGCLIGNMASFVNVLKMNGITYAMKSGILAAESVIEAIIDAESNTSPTKGLEPKTYTDKIKNSWIYKELKAVRNIRPSFNSYLGIYGGLMYSGFSMLLGGREPWTLSHTREVLIRLRK